MWSRVTALAEQHGIEDELGWSQQPSTQALADALAAVAAGDDNSFQLTVANAAQVFTYLRSRLDDFNSGLLKRLRTLCFVPTLDLDEDDVVKLCAPVDVFVEDVREGVVELSGEESNGDVVAMDVEAAPARKGRGRKSARKGKVEGVADGVGDLSPCAHYKGLLCYVDYGKDASVFLRACGSQGTPSGSDVAEALLRVASSSQQAFTRFNRDRYLSFLHVVARDFDRLPRTLLQRLRIAPILLASTPRVGGADGEEATLEACLSAASQVFLIDNSTWEHLLQPLRSAPMEANRPGALQRFYEGVGVRWLTAAVDEECAPGGAISPLGNGSLLH